MDLRIKTKGKKMNININNVTFDAYKTFTKKEDLEVYSRITLKFTEDGYPNICPIFTGKDTYLEYIRNYLERDPDGSANFKLDEEFNVTFGETTFDAVLSEIKIRIDKNRNLVHYSLVLDKKTDAKEINTLVIPYFRTRELIQEPEPENNKKKKRDTYQNITYEVVLDNGED